jgi:hypothetical protein
MGFSGMLVAFPEVRILFLGFTETQMHSSETHESCLRDYMLNRNTNRFENKSVDSDNRQRMFSELLRKQAGHIIGHERNSFENMSRF